MNWSQDEEKLIYYATRRATSGFLAIPRGYEKEDILQEVAAAWVKTRENYNVNYALSTQIYRVALATVNNLYKMNGRIKRQGDLHAIKYMENFTERWVI